MKNPRPLSANMRLALDFAPLGVFLLGYQMGNLMMATLALTVATMVSLVIIYWCERRIAPTPLISGIAVAVFGGLTIIFDNEQFIKMKPTIVNLLFAAILLAGAAMRKPTLRYMLGSAIPMEEIGWHKLGIRWGIFFIGLAALNEYIWRHYSTDFWVNFKVFGMLVLTTLFTFMQMPLMQRHIIIEEETKDSA